MKRKRNRPKKRLGQNFLYDPAIAEKIVDATGLGPGDPVVELGAGRGILTRALVARGVRLIAIEIDDALVAELRDELPGWWGDRGGTPPELVHADLAGVDLADLLDERKIGRCAVVGNIPYYLTREVFFGFLVDGHDRVDRAYIMMQKEVGNRVVSAAGSRVYGITSVILQTLYETRVVTKVAPGSFIPRPRVSSVVLEFVARPDTGLAPGELSSLRELVRNVFQQRRKTIHSTLRSFYSLPEASLEAVSRRSGVDLQLRPEALDTETFLRLSRSLTEVLESR